MMLPRRALYAAGLLTALLGAWLVAWFVSGWADVRGRQRTVREAPRLAAEQRDAELAHELRGELGALLSREVDRPYFHYQNLFHDPRASAGPSVAPSPLAGGPDDALVLGYFQFDADGRTTTPTLNDELPELSEPKHLADNRRFRDEVTRSLASALTPHSAEPLVAALTPPPPRSVPSNPLQQPRHVSPAEQAGAQAPVKQAPAQQQRLDQQQAHIVTIDPDTYVQNSWSNNVYRNQQRAMPQARWQQAPQQALSPQARLQQALPQQAARAHITEPPKSITITVSPLEWRTLGFAGQPTMVAVHAQSGRLKLLVMP